MLYPFEAINPVIKASTNPIILVHNHLSGDCKLSKEDEKITNMLYDARKILGIKVLDHVIIGNNNFASVKE